MSRAGLAVVALAAATGCAGSTPATDERGTGASRWAGPPDMGYVFLRVRADVEAGTGVAADTATAPVADTATSTGTGEAIPVDRDRPLLLHARADSWEMRVGEPRWSRGTPLATWSVDRSGGFSLAGVLVLPGKPDVGATEQGTRVVSIDAVTTWGGTFPEVLTVQVGEDRPGDDTGAAPAGDLAGPRGLYQFARDLGPVALTLPDGRWELVRWEPLPPGLPTTATATATTR